MIRQFVGYLKEDQNKTLVHSKQVNKSWPQFRQREVEGCIIEIRIIKKIITHLYTVPSTVLRDFFYINSFNPHNLRGGTVNDDHFFIIHTEA